ncbi:hypothetical protein OC846_000220 [Tilletia horrida]|uniref:UDP-glucuronic acid decarboxylase 1 n=1 Tax=Tilletia horrida TaxID=155126 RepID=A0AAN6GXI4_9BASI|nr:hypothetical protein OC846_000220 [Tilletia horrida]
MSSIEASSASGAYGASSPQPSQSQPRTVSAQRGTARIVASVKESPRLLRRSTSNSSHLRTASSTSQHALRQAGGPSPIYHSMSSSSSLANFPYGQLGPSSSNIRVPTSSSAISASSSTNSHSPRVNEPADRSPTGSYTSSRADTLDVPFEVGDRLSQSSLALNAAVSQRLVGTSPSLAHSRAIGQYASTRVLPFGEQLRILVTGGAGFVGSHLVDRLMMEGHEVLVMDNFFTGSKANLSNWVGHPNFELLRHDVVNPLLVEVDQIYHLACPASPKDYQSNEIKTLKTCFLGTLNMLGLAKRTRARFLLASTSEVYGDPLVSPQREDYFGNCNPIGWRACYDEGKRISETLTYAYHQDGVDVRVARIFNTYGPNLSAQDGRVVSNFLLQALKGQPLTIFGDGSQTRSFCYVDDLVDGLISLMNRVPSESGDDGTIAKSVDVHSPVNLGNPNEFTIRELVDVVGEVVRELRDTRRQRGLNPLRIDMLDAAGSSSGTLEPKTTAQVSALSDRLENLATSSTAAPVAGSAHNRSPNADGTAGGSRRTSISKPTLDALPEVDATPLALPAPGPASPEERLDLNAPALSAMALQDEMHDKDSPLTAMGPTFPVSVHGLRGKTSSGEVNDVHDIQPQELSPSRMAEPPDDPESVQIEYRPLPSDDPKVRCPEITRARELLGWEPRWSLRDGLMQTALYFEALLEEGLI